MVKRSIENRLSSYWRLELLNVIAVPAFGLFLSYQFEQPLGVATLIAAIPMCGLLIIGGLYWRAKLREITRAEAPNDTIKALARADAPLLLLTLIGIIAATAAAFVPAARVSLLDAWMAGSAAILALLEYINYYHRQLQHFDRWSDFKRLLSGRGFRRSKLNEDMIRLGLRKPSQRRAA